MDALCFEGPKYEDILPAYAVTDTPPFIPAPPSYSTLAPVLRPRSSTSSLRESTPIDPDSQRPTPLPSSLTAFDITLDNPKLCFRGIDSSPTSSNADELDSFQRDCPARLTGALHLCVAPDSPFSTHAPNAQTLTSISLRIRGTERTSPRDLSTAYGYRTILDSRVTLWERNTTASGDSEVASDDNATERMMAFRLTIPPHCPPTYQSKWGQVKYHVDVLLMRVGNLPDVVVRAPFTIARAPTKLELNRWVTAATATTEHSHPRWSTPSDGVIDIAKLGSANRYIAMPSAGAATTVVSAQLEQTATYRGRAAPLLRRPRPTSWTRSATVATLDVESVRHHGGGSFATVGLRFPAETSPQLMQDATGGLITVQHEIVLRLRDHASGKSREARLGVKVVPSY